MGLSKSSVAFESLVSKGLWLFDFKIGVFNSVGKSESFFEDGVDDKIMVVSPCSSQTEQSVVLRFSVWSKLVVKLGIQFSSAEGLAEEDQLQIFIKGQLKVGIGLFDSSDLSDQLVDQKRKGNLVSNGRLVLGWDEDGLVDFYLDFLLDFNLNDSGELDEIVKFGQESLDDLDLDLEGWGLDL